MTLTFLFIEKPGPRYLKMRHGCGSSQDGHFDATLAPHFCGSCASVLRSQTPQGSGPAWLGVAWRGGGPVALATPNDAPARFRTHEDGWLDTMTRTGSWFSVTSTRRTRRLGGEVGWAAGREDCGQDTCLRWWRGLQGVNLLRALPECSSAWSGGHRHGAGSDFGLALVSGALAGWSRPGYAVGLGPGCRCTLRRVWALLWALPIRMVPDAGRRLEAVGGICP